MCAEIAVFVLNLPDIIFLRTAPHSDNTGRFKESDHTIQNSRFWNIALHLGEHNTQRTSTPWVNKQGNYRICL